MTNVALLVLTRNLKINKSTSNCFSSMSGHFLRFLHDSLELKCNLNTKKKTFTKQSNNLTRQEDDSRGDITLDSVDCNTQTIV